MRTVLSILIVAFMASGAWATNELSDPSFETGGLWTITGGGGALQNHLKFSTYGIPGSGYGTYGGGVAGQNLSFPGGKLSQIVDESKFPGWIEGGTAKQVTVSFRYFQMSYADVPMNLLIYLDYMMDGTYPVEGQPGYVYQQIGQITNWNTGGVWKNASYSVLLPVQPRYLSLHFDFTYFSGTGANVIDAVDLQGQCIPEPSSLLAMATGLFGVVGILRRRR